MPPLSQSHKSHRPPVSARACRSQTGSSLVPTASKLSVRQRLLIAVDYQPILVPGSENSHEFGPLGLCTSMPPSIIKLSRCPYAVDDAAHSEARDSARTARNAVGGAGSAAGCSRTEEAKDWGGGLRPTYRLLPPKQTR